MQTQRFPKAQAHAVEDEKQRSHASEPQRRTLQCRYATQKHLNLLGGKNAGLKMSSDCRDWLDLFRHESVQIESFSVQTELSNRDQIVASGERVPIRICI